MDCGLPAFLKEGWFAQYAVLHSGPAVHCPWCAPAASPIGALRAGIAYRPSLLTVCIAGESQHSPLFSPLSAQGRMSPQLAIPSRGAIGLHQYRITRTPELPRPCWLQQEDRDNSTRDQPIRSLGRFDYPADHSFKWPRPRRLHRGLNGHQVSQGRQASDRSRQGPQPFRGTSMKRIGQEHDRKTLRHRQLRLL